MSTLKLFEWQADIGASLQSQSTATPVKFGDGYEERIANGLHPVMTAWSVSFTRPGMAILEIHKFLKEQAGIQAFRWVNPLGEELVYICRSWAGPQQVDRGLYQITASFEEVFES